MRNQLAGGLIKGVYFCFLLCSVISCTEETESKTYFFKLDGVNYAVDYTTCKEQDNNFLVLCYRKSPESISDFSCEFTFYGYTSTPPEGTYQVRGISNNVAQGYVDLLVRGGNFGVTYLGTNGVVSVAKVNGKTEYSFVGVDFEAPGGISKTGSAELKCY
jgi:hypothetical protein